MSSIFAEGSTASPYFSDNSFISLIAFLMSRTPFLVISLPKIIFSATVNASTSIKCWCTIPIPKEAAFDGESSLTTCPFTAISPLVGSSNPANIFIKVDLPAPFSPKRA